MPQTPVPIGSRYLGPDSVAIAGRHADCMIATEPEKSLTEGFSAASGSGKPRYGQIPVCYDKDEDAARARRLWLRAASGWHVMSELPEPRSFEAASEHITEDDIASQVGGDHQDKFIKWAERELLPTLRDL